jgi:hypothetical protein
VSGVKVVNGAMMPEYGDGPSLEEFCRQLPSSADELWTAVETTEWRASFNKAGTVGTPRDTEVLLYGPHAPEGGSVAELRIEESIAYDGRGPRIERIVAEIVPHRLCSPQIVEIIQEAYRRAIDGDENPSHEDQEAGQAS